MLDKIKSWLKRPSWACAVLAILGLGGMYGFNAWLERQTARAVAEMQEDMRRPISVPVRLSPQPPAP